MLRFIVDTEYNLNLIMIQYRYQWHLHIQSVRPIMRQRFDFFDEAILLFLFSQAPSF